MLCHLPRAVLQRPYVVPRAVQPAVAPLSRSFATTRIACKKVTKEDVEAAALATAEQEQLEGLPVDLPTPGATSGSTASAPSAGTSAAGGNTKAASSGKLSEADVRKAALAEAEIENLEGLPTDLPPGAAYKASTRPLNESEKSGVWWLLGGVAAVVAGGYWFDKRYDANKVAKQAKDKAHDLQDEAAVKARELKGQAEAAKTGAIDKANELKDKAVAAKDQAVDKTIAAKDQAVDSAIAAKDKAVQKSLDAKNEVVDKVSDAADSVKKAVSGK